MIWTKGARQSAKFQTFDWSREISLNLYFHRLILLKVYKISAEKVSDELYLMTRKSDAKFEEKLTCCFKNDKNLVNFDPSTQKSQKFELDWFLLCKVCNFWAKKIQKSYISWQWRLMQNLKKIWLMFAKWQEEFGKFSPEHFKVSKLGHWWDPFVQSRKCKC